MASDSLKSMYKVKLREENTTSSRRTSRGLERKKHREDEVNKRRLLSGDMSPLMEENMDRSSHDRSQDRHCRPVTHEKVSTRLERLKQWREEKQRKTQQQKKGSQKPVFKVSPLKHIGESNLYRTEAQEVKPGKQRKRTYEHKVSATVVNSTQQQVKAQTRAVNLAGSSAVTADRKSPKHQPGRPASTRHRQAVAVQQEKISQPGTSSQPASRPDQKAQRSELASKPDQKAQRSDLASKPHQKAQRSDLASKPHQKAQRSELASKPDQKAQRSEPASKPDQKAQRSDLASKLTVSAAAKAKSNMDQPKTFLRANSRVTRARAHNQAVDDKKQRNSRKKETQDNITPREAVETVDHMEVDCASEAEHSQSSSDSKELHLSDSAVSTPKHSTPAAKRRVGREKTPASTKKQNVENLQKTPGRVTDKPADSWSKDVSAMVAAEEVNVEQLQGPLLSQDVVRGQGWRLPAEIDHKKGSTDVDTTIESLKTPVVSVVEMSNKENVAGAQSQSQELTPSRNRETCADMSVSRRQKSQPRSQHLASTNGVEVISTPSTAKRSKRSVSRPRGGVNADLALEVRDDTSTQLPDDGTALQHSHKKPLSSAGAKRRSVRIASLAFSSPAYEDELVTTKYRKTPAVKRRPSAAAPLKENSNRSTFVSVSDEGTSHLNGENIVDRMDTSATATSGLMRQPEATADDPSTVIYEVRKPQQVEAGLRALQELVVRKFEGEASFIEVTLDDSTDADASVSTKSLSVPALVAASADKDISSTTAATEEDNQSTQPFTPRSHEITTLEDSSRILETPSLAPRSSRSRGLSMSGLSSFKTPGQPVSTTRSRVGSRRRQTDMSTAMKSPEEMIEILKNSPMVELTRRRSRHARLSSVRGEDQSSSVHSLDVSSLAMNRLDVNSLDSSIHKSEDTELTSCPPASDHLLPAAREGPQTMDIMQLDVAGGVQHFRQLLLTEMAKLQQLCETWTQVSTGSLDLAEDVLGQIRSTIGKAQLLMDQRFQQFSGLVDNCQFGLGEKATTLTDLQGFWEMIYFQVEDVSQLFADLTQRQHTNWQVKQPSPARNIPKRKVVKISKPKVKSNFAAFREEIIKRKAQAVVKPSTVTADHHSVPTKVFDAGFFKVTSPVRSSGRKSQQHNLLISATATSSSGSQETADTSRDETTQSPVTAGNKENHLANTPSSRLLPLSAKRLSYLPAVPSPLLNDITGMLTKRL